MLRIKLTSALISGFAIGSVALAQEDVKPGVKTDMAHYEQGPAPTLPEAGETFVDPVFGTTLLRVTDERDGKQNNVAYSYWPTFNKDATRFHISMSGQPTLFEFDPAKMKIGRKEPLFPKVTEAGTRPRWEDSIWSATEPNVIFGHDTQRLWAYDVASKQYTLLHDFKSRIQQMSRSVDDNVFAFGSRNEDGAGYVVWQREPDKILIQQNLPTLDEVQIDKSGKFLLIKTALQGKGLIQAQVADLTTGKVEDLVDDAPDYAPGHSDNGTGFVIGHDNWRNQMTGRKLKDPHEHITVLDLKRDWTQGQHLSMSAEDERWVLISFYGGVDKPVAGPFKGEIIQVATDGSQRVRRLAHHRSNPGRNYWMIPMANISRDGRFVAFTSNFGTAQTDVFILKVPSFTEAEEYPIKDHPLIEAPAE